MKGIVLGGGLSGLGAALELSKHTDDITLIEREPNLMGVLSSFEVEGWWIPKFYHHLSDKITRDFFKEAGLYDQVVETPVKFSFFLERYNRFYELSKIKLLFFKPFTLYDKFKFGLMGINLLLRNQSIKKLDKVSAEEWLNKSVSKNVSRFFGNLIEKHKFPIPFSQVSAAWLYDRFKLEIGRQDTLGYPKGKRGWEMISDYAQKNIKGKILTSTSAEKIVIENGIVTKVILPNETIELTKDDLVVCGLPPYVMTKISEGLPEDLEKKLNSIDYAANICLVIGTDENLTDYYWVNTIGEYPFGTIIAQNPLYGEGEFPWKVYYVSTYCSKDDPQMKMSDEELFKYYMGYMEKIFNKKIETKWYKVNKTPVGGAIEKMGLLDNIPTNDEIVNLKFAGQYMTYPKERSTGETIMSGRSAVRKFVESRKPIET